VSARPELEITPEPTAEERVAIEAAVAELVDGSGTDALHAEWWLAGILDATDESDEP
jgi:hypothetical protein